MDGTIVAASITAVVSVIGAALTFYFTKKHELEVKWRDEKMNHYRVLLSSLSDLAVDGTDKDDARKKFALAANTIVLAAPQRVIAALLALHDEVLNPNPNPSMERHDKLFKDLILAIRRDIGLAGDDDTSTFTFHLIGPAPNTDRSNSPQQKVNRRR